MRWSESLTHPDQDDSAGRFLPGPRNVMLGRRFRVVRGNLILVALWVVRATGAKQLNGWRFADSFARRAARPEHPEEHEPNHDEHDKARDNQ